MNDKLVSILKEKLNPIFLQEKYIAVAFLFGSHTQEEANKNSDIDLAILLMPNTEISVDDLLNLEVKITKALNTEHYDLVIANKASIVMQFRILKGMAFFIANERVYTDFYAKVLENYLDFLPRLKEFNRDYFSALRQRYCL